MPHGIRDILENKEVIAIDQDALGKEGTRISPAGEHEVWVRQLKDGGLAVVLFNRSKKDAVMRISSSDLGRGIPISAQVRDLWKHEDRGAFRTGYSARVPGHGAVMLRLSEPAIK